MNNNNFLTFNIFKTQRGLINGVFGKNFGNIDFKFGDKNKVLKSRQKIAVSLNIQINNVYEMEQVHGSNIEILDFLKVKKIKTQIGNKLAEADGLITNLKNIFLMVKTADCFPLLFFDPKKKVIGLAHVGWRGAVEKIFLMVLLKMANNFGCQIRDILIGIGPGIGPCCFKHKTLIQQKLPEWKNYIKEKNGLRAINIAYFIKDQLINVGVKEQNIDIIDICVSCSKGFFSHFKSLKTGEAEGRFASIIGMIND